MVQVEGIGMEPEALARLGGIGESASLRHAVQLLTPAHVLAKSNSRCAPGSRCAEAFCIPSANTCASCRAWKCSATCGAGLALPACQLRGLIWLSVRRRLPQEPETCRGERLVPAGMLMDCVM